MTKMRAEDRYVETAILTATPEELIVKTYDALLQFSRAAVEKLRTDPKDIEFIHNRLTRAQSACAVLTAALNFDVGGELAVNLCRIYDFWHHQLKLANLWQDPEPVEQILPAIVDYRQTWVRIIEGAKNERKEALVGALES